MQDLGRLAPVVSSALLTDQYELTMLDAALDSGVADRRAVFEVFARRLPSGRRYGVVGGVGRLADALGHFRFGEAELSWLADQQFLAPKTLEWLSRYRFGGSIHAYREGELFFPHSPVLVVEGSFGEALVLETVILSILNHDAAIAAAAARMVAAAGSRPLIEAGSRRTHESAAPAAARAAYVAGFVSTSNLEAGRRFGVPTGGTTGHAFVLAHDDEAAAFTSQLMRMGAGSTYLVDTFDIAGAIETAVSVAGTALGAIRIDSGDLAEEARRARAQLDRLGATRTRIVVSGDLDEFAIAALADAPVDAMLVGTELVTGSAAPTAGFVYKLVAVGERQGTDAVLRRVEKRSRAKATRGGSKRAFRELDRAGVATRELLVGPADPSPPSSRELLVPLIDRGDLVADVSIDGARAHHRRVLSELAVGGLSIEPGPPALVAVDYRRDRG